MKRILITGANSYIGTSFENYIKSNYPEDYQVDTIDMIDGAWKEKSFTGYDSVFHVAGIAHQKETRDNADIYYKVNRDLAIETAKKAKQDGVQQFVFLSSMSVYGIDEGVITKDTVPNPKSNYGKSKLEAEVGIRKLESSSFKVCVLRPPMVYGKGCRGNFNKIKKFVHISPIFPLVKNQRSMIYIDNLNSFVKLCVDLKLQNLYFPQNRDYVQTMDMAKAIANSLNKKIFFERISGLVILLAKRYVPVLKKAFGTLIYEIEDSYDYCVINSKESLVRSV